MSLRVRLLAAASACLVAIGGLGGPAAASKARVVDCRRGHDLQAVLDAAAPGDRIAIRGRCVGAFVVKVPDLTLVGKGRRPTLSGRKGIDDPVLSADLVPGTRLVGLTIANGRGFGVVGPAMTLLDVTVRDNRSAGVVASPDHGPARIVRSRILRNGGQGHCAIHNATDLTITATLVKDNRECGISNTSSIDIKPTLVLRRSKVLHTRGRGILNTWLLTLRDSVVRGNDARHSTYRPGRGGGIYNALAPIQWQGGFVTLVGSRVVGNRAKVGGGIYSTGAGFLTRQRSVVARNRVGDCIVVPQQLGPGGELEDGRPRPC